VTAEIADPNYEIGELTKEERKSVSTLTDQSLMDDDDDDDVDEGEKDDIKSKDEEFDKDELRDNISKYFVS